MAGHPNAKMPELKHPVLGRQPLTVQDRLPHQVFLHRELVLLAVFLKCRFCVRCPARPLRKIERRIKARYDATPGRSPERIDELFGCIQSRWSSDHVQEAAGGAASRDVADETSYLQFRPISIAASSRRRLDTIAQEVLPEQAVLALGRPHLRRTHRRAREQSLGGAGE